jgi:hypothetical protein
MIRNTIYIMQSEEKKEQARDCNMQSGMARSAKFNLIDLIALNKKEGRVLGCGYFHFTNKKRRSPKSEINA